MRAVKSVFSSGLPSQQLDALQKLVTKHIQDPALADLATSKSEFSRTSTERGVLRWEQAHLVAALDVLNAYQRERRARSSCQVSGLRLGRDKQFTDDPRTRLVELLKRWLRTHAGRTTVTEDEVRGICGLCRDILDHPKLFPARNPRSFLRSVAEVYEHLQRQLREVLERDRTCAELAQQVLSLSRNLISDAIGFLLVAPTDLRQTDGLPSLEVVALWHSLPEEGHPLPGRADPKLQRIMQDAWRTPCGSVVAAVLCAPWCVRLFDSAGAEDEAKAAAAASQFGIQDSPAPGRTGSAALPPRLLEVAAQFEKGDFRNSGLAGILRLPVQSASRSSYLSAVELVFDLMYLLGEVLVQFYRISDGLGDYGMIRVAPWLHPFLEALAEKVQRLKSCLEQVSSTLDTAYVLARARGDKVEKPAPTDRMCARAHTCVERAILGRDGHAVALLRSIEELRARSAPERLPHVMGSLGDACTTLQAVLASPDFLARVGNGFPELPPLGNVAAGPSPAMQQLQQLQLEDGLGSDSEEEAGPPPTFTVRATSLSRTPRDLEPNPWQPRSASPQAKVRASSCPRLRGSGGDNRMATQGSREASSDSRPPAFTAPRLLGSAASLPFGSRTPASKVSGSEAYMGALADDAIWAQVSRMALARTGGGLRRHDRRSLAVSQGMLYVFDIGSTTKIKSVFDIERDIEDAYLEPGAILALRARRPVEGASVEDGVFEHKEYMFEFATTDLAITFHDQLTEHRLRRL